VPTRLLATRAEPAATQPMHLGAG